MSWLEVFRIEAEKRNAAIRAEISSLRARAHADAEAAEAERQKAKTESERLTAKLVSALPPQGKPAEPEREYLHEYLKYPPGSTEYRRAYLREWRQKHPRYNADYHVRYRERMRQQREKMEGGNA